MSFSSMSFSSMSFSPEGIRHLQELARQLRAMPHHVDVLDAVLQGEAVADPAAVPEAVNHVRALAATVSRLKALVSGDGLGRRIDSLPELILRAQGQIVRTALAELRELAVDPAVRCRLDTLAITPFEAIEDWIGYVAHKMAGTAQVWLCYREDVASDPTPYRAALREAHAELRRLAEQSKATPFLSDAINRADWPALQESCSQIVVALTIPIDIEFRVPLVMVSTRNSRVERSS
jgi:hypothetical protein